MDRFGSAWFSGGIFPLKCSYCKLAWTSVGCVAVAMFEFSTFLSIILRISFPDSYLLFSCHFVCLHLTFVRVLGVSVIFIFITAVFLLFPHNYLMLLSCMFVWLYPKS